MEDTMYFNSLKHLLNNSKIMNNSIQGEMSDLSCFNNHLLELGYGYVVAKSIKYEGYSFDDLPIDVLKKENASQLNIIDIDNSISDQHNPIPDTEKQQNLPEQFRETLQSVRLHSY